MGRLFLATLCVLFLPKVAGLTLALATGSFRRASGGGLRLLVSAAVELLLSALIAPIMMLIHSAQIFEILAGRDAGWAPQRRDAGETAWATAWRRHRFHMSIGLATAGFAWFLSPTIFAWLSPTLLGLVLAAPLSQMSGSTAVGLAMRRFGLFLTPEEEGPPAIIRDFQALHARAASGPANAIRAIAEDAALREAHFRFVNPSPRRRGAPEAAYLTAAHKIGEAETLDEALQWLDHGERVQVAGERALAEQLARLVRTPPPAGPEEQPLAAATAA